LAERKKESTRKKIIKVATSLFSERGFDAATVDQIAAKAKVNKALIYYYFKNKKDLLAKIFDSFIEEGLVRFQELFARMESKEVFDSRDRVDELMAILLDFMKENKEILKLMLMESIKGKRDPFLEIMKRQAGKELAGLADDARDKGVFLDEDATQMWVTEFFTGSIPMMVYMIYRSRWAEFFGVAEEVLDKMFVTAFNETHIEHHRK
jgi:AcrR family transcriptional regulator